MADIGWGKSPATISSCKRSSSKSPIGFMRGMMRAFFLALLRSISLKACAARREGSKIVQSLSGRVVSPVGKRASTSSAKISRKGAPAAMLKTCGPRLSIFSLWPIVPQRQECLGVCPHQTNGRGVQAHKVCERRWPYSIEHSLKMRPQVRAQTNVDEQYRRQYK